MREITRIVKMYDTTDHPQMAIAVVVNVQDSSYRRVGARMLIAPDGQWIGGVSGGCLEGDIHKHAQSVIFTGQAKMIRYDTRDHDPSQIGVGLGCRGLIDVWISAVDRSQPDNAVELLRPYLSIRSPVTTITVIDSDDDRWAIGSIIDKHQIIHPSAISEQILHRDQITLINNEVNRISDNYASTIISTKTDHGLLRLFVEVIKPVIRLFIYGYHYDVHPIVCLAHNIGWEVYVISPKRKMSAQWIDAGARWIDHEDDIKMDTYSAVILMAHDYKTDLSNLVKMAHMKAAYIGMLGPRDRKEDMLQQLSKDQRLIIEQHLYAPVGLDIGATTPETIALSILAEITAHFNMRQGGHLRDRLDRINDN